MCLKLAKMAANSSKMKSTKVQTLGELCMCGYHQLMGWAFSMRLLVVSTLVARRESDTG